MRFSISMNKGAFATNGLVVAGTSHPHSNGKNHEWRMTTGPQSIERPTLPGSAAIHSKEVAMYQKTLLGVLDREDWQALKEVTTHVKVKEGKILFEEGEPEGYIYFIQKGCVSLGHLSDTHEWVDFGIYGEVDLSKPMEMKKLENATWLDRIVLKQGALVGEPVGTSLPHHHLSARCDADCELLQIDTEQMSQLKKDHPHLFNSMNLFMKEHVHALDA
ncbi:MAG: cyclic nucleotide-binding domain-containing protein [Magnetococcales bacterium]|nr:cyclic nucleotide-binding domain-containing protein [Magnetococcales bacterium]